MNSQRQEERAIGNALNAVRDIADAEERMQYFRQAIADADAAALPGAALCIAGVAGVFQSGVGYARELSVILWPRLGSLRMLLAGMPNLQFQHFGVWGVERLLYYAIEYPEVPAPALERALREWLDALDELGGYTRASRLRLRLHIAIRMGRLEEAQSLFAALANIEPEESLEPNSVKLPGDPEDFGSGKPADDFGCSAYYQQVRVLYHCAVGNIHRALPAARHLLDGRSSCDLSFCAAAPREALATLLEPLQRAGYLKEAEQAHARGLPLVKGRPNALGLLGHHLRFLVRNGRHAQAAELAEGARGQRNRTTSPFQSFHLLRGLRAVHGGDAGGGQEALRCEEEAAALARRFDARNGTAYYAKLLQEDLAHLPLNPNAATRSTHG